jgi:glutamyl-Q tRNA(Asp) synthetase
VQMRHGLQVDAPGDEGDALHRLLQALMGWPVPRYAHHGLLTDTEGKRLAKRDNAATLRSLREAGVSPAAVRAMAGFA